MNILVVLRACLLCLTLCASGVALADRPLESFGNSTWSSLQKELPRPAAVVFTATYCATCPQVLKQLATTLRERHLDAPLVAVVIDDADPATLAIEHYALAQRIFVFDGDEAALRYSVDPQWHGETPFVALLSRQGPAQWITGIPSKKQLALWLRE